jgi:hypothetical protein
LAGFYQQWLPLYEQRIGPWRDYQKHKPMAGSEKTEEAQIFRDLWKPKDTALLEELKQELLDGPVLKRPDWNRRFYLKTDWSKDAMAGAILQPKCSEAAEEEILKEVETGICNFDKTISGLRLRPIAFISGRCKGKGQDYHSSVGEVATGRWGMIKFKLYLWFRPFTWITDCSGIYNFYEMELLPTHQQQ